MTSPLSRIFRFYSSTRSPSRCYYEVLGLSRGATEKDIRSAFIKLSKIYHPDREKGDRLKFQELSSAYEVLRKQKSREEYDRGLFGGDARWRSGSSYRPSPTRPAEPAGPIYNYDDWLRSHYGERMKQRRQDTATNRLTKEERREAKKAALRRLKLEKIVIAVSLLVIFFCWPGRK